MKIVPNLAKSLSLSTVNKDGQSESEKQWISLTLDRHPRGHQVLLNGQRGFRLIKGSFARMVTDWDITLSEDSQHTNNNL